LKCSAVVLYYDQSPQNCSSQKIKQIPQNKIMVISPAYFLWFNLWYNSIIVNFWHVKKAFHICPWDDGSSVAIKLIATIRQRFPSDMIISVWKQTRWRLSCSHFKIKYCLFIPLFRALFKLILNNSIIK
jgi:hypothetical protein